MEELGEADNDEIRYLKLCYALAITTVGLKDYVLTKFRTLLEEISKNCRECHDCLGPCSNRNFCANCTIWKNTILVYHKHQRPKINWNSIDNSKWRTDPKELMKMFTYVNPQDVKQNHLTLDLCNILSLFENCNIFRLIHTDNIEKLRRARNRSFAHTMSGTIEQNELDKFLRYMYTIFHIAEIRKTSSGEEAFNKLSRLQAGDWALSKSGGQPSFVSHGSEFERNIAETLESMKKEQRDIRTVLTRIDSSLPDPAKTKTNQVIIITCTVCMLFGLCLFMFFFLKYSTVSVRWNVFRRSESSTVIDCFKIPSLPFYEVSYPYDLYRRGHQIADRTWLRTKIETELFGAGRGVFLEAEIGFGSKAFIESLLCAPSSGKSGRIRSHTIAFNRCMFESNTTREPEHFIMILATGLANFFPEYRNYIENDEEIQITIKEQCTKNIFACFDIVIRYPLDNLGLSPKSVVVVVLDSFDKCVDHSQNNTDITELLESRILELPSYIKFLITSAPMFTGVKHSLKEVNMKLDTSEHIKDVTSFLTEAVQQRKHAFRHLLNQFKNDTDEMIQTLVNVSRANFRFLASWLKLDTLTMEQLKSQNVLYLNVFKQHFGRKAEMYQTAKIIFELLCAADNIMLEEDLIAVAEFASKDRTINVKGTIYGTMRPFLRIADGFVSIQKSLQDWLLNKKNNELFSISVESGHAAIVRNHFHQYPTEPILISDAISLIEHVAKAKKKPIEAEFLVRVTNDLKQFSVEGDLLEELLLNVPVMLDCYECVDLVFKLFDAEKRKIDEQTIYSRILDTGKASTINSLKYFIDVLYKKKVPEKGLQTTDKQAKKKYIQEFICPLLEIVVEHMESKYYKILEFDILPRVSLADHYNLIMSSLRCNHGCVDELIEKGVKDICLQCKEYNVIESRVNPCVVQQTSIISENTEHIKELLVDICPFVCESEQITFKTALHASIASGNSHLAEKILNALPRKTRSKHIKCRSNGGWTPLLVAARYDNLKSFISLYKNETDQRKHITCPHRESGICNVCPVKASVAHLVFLYGAKNIVQHLEKQYIAQHIEKQSASVNGWNIPNQFNGATPIFYAICSELNNEVYLSVSVNRINTSSLTRSFISAFHLCVLCRNLDALEYLQSQSGKILKGFDSKGFGLFHYLFLVIRPTEYDQKDMETFSKIVNLLLSSGHSFYETDNSGRNLLHLAVMSARYEEFVELMTLYPVQMLQLFVMKDVYGLTPLDLAIKQLGYDSSNRINVMVISSLVRLLKQKVGIPSKIFSRSLNIGGYKNTIYQLLYKSLEARLLMYDCNDAKVWFRFTKTTPYQAYLLFL